jgi:hypothetical protein
MLYLIVVILAGVCLFLAVIGASVHPRVNPFPLGMLLWLISTMV